MIGNLVESFSALQYAQIAAASAILYFVGTIIYRLFFHPLARFPGPLMAKVTDLYSMYHARLGDVHYDMYACHQKYGNIVRYGPNKLTVDTNTGLKEIHGHSKNIRKSDMYKCIPINPNGPYNTHNVIDKTVHGRKRRILSQGFSDATLKSYEPMVQERVDALCTRLMENPAKDGWSATKNMSDWFNYLTFDVIAGLAWGNPFHMIENDETHFIIDVIDHEAHQFGTFFQFPYIINRFFVSIKPYLRRILFGPGSLTAQKKFMGQAKDMVEQRMKKEEEEGKQEDIFGFLLEAKDPETGEGFQMEELLAESRLLLVAGSDTSSTALAATFYYLVKNPHALNKLRDELEQFEFVDELSNANLAPLHYLRAVIEEGLRMSPPIGGAPWRSTLNEGILLDGEAIPAGVDLGIATYAIQHNEKYYPEPFKFKPERWLGDSAEASRSAFCAFQIGSRGCIGKSLAYMELTLAVAKIVYKYNFRLDGDGSESEKQMSGGKIYRTRDQFTAWKNGPMLQFKTR